MESVPKRRQGQGLAIQCLSAAAFPEWSLQADRETDQRNDPWRRERQGLQSEMQDRRWHFWDIDRDIDRHEQRHLNWHLDRNEHRYVNRYVDRDIDRHVHE